MYIGNKQYLSISLDIYKICIYHADSRQPQTQSTEQTPSSVASLHSIGSSYSSELKNHSRLLALGPALQLARGTSMRSMHTRDLSRRWHRGTKVTN